MNLKFWQEKPSIYDDPIEKVLTELKAYGPGDPDFDVNISRLEKLNELKQKTKTALRVSPDTLAVCATTVLTTVIIVAYEQYHPMVSKAMNERPKPKF